MSARTSLRTTIAALVALMVWTAPVSAQEQEPACPLDAEAEAGMKAAKQCQGCHVFAPNRESRPTGPNLAQVFGAKAGSLADFKRYSEGMKLLAEKGLIWTAENLDAYIRDPRPFVASQTGRDDVMHGMFFKLIDAEKRAQVIGYIKRLGECHGPR